MSAVLQHIVGQWWRLLVHYRLQAKHTIQSCKVEAYTVVMI